MTRKNITIMKDEYPFICIRCGFTVTGPESGTVHRNHCPNCLYSRHVDFRTGDRMSVCRGLMVPFAITETSGELSIIHRCIKCGTMRLNRIAGDDNTEVLFKIFRRLELSMVFFDKPQEDGGVHVSKY